MKRVNKKKKAFTLIELLAVIVILGIIALIVGATISGVIENADKASYKESVRNIVRSAENYMGKYLILNNKDLVYPVVFTCDGTACMNGQEKLDFAGAVPLSGEIILESYKSIKAEYLYNGKYCASGSKNDIQVSKSCADIDTKRPLITGTLNGNILSLTLTDNESGIDSYCVTSTTDLNSCTWNQTNTSNVTYTLSVSGTYYAFAKDKKGNVSEMIEFITGDIEKPTVEVTRDGKVLTITLSDNASVASYCVTTDTTSANCTWIEADSNVVTYTLLEQGTYYVYAKDTSGNTSDGASIVAPATAFCAFDIGTEWHEFAAGSSTSWQAPCNGLYELEVWGASGGNSQGGYSVGYVHFNIGDVIYISCGGIGVGGKSAAGGYNGGGASGGQSNYNSSGGGATHIAKVSGTLASIGYDSFVTQGNGYIVAGGGGGSCGTWSAGGTTAVAGGNGGGTTGSNGTYWQSQSASGYAGSGGGQSSGASFGQGGAGYSDSNYGNGGGGGGGFYGGTGGYGSYPSSGTGGGGSGWVGGVPEIVYKGETYSPSTTNGGNSDAGKAKITLVAY